MRQSIAAGIMAIVGLVIAACMVRAASELFGIWPWRGLSLADAAAVAVGAYAWLCCVGLTVLWAAVTLGEGKANG